MSAPPAAHECLTQWLSLAREALRADPAARLAGAGRLLEQRAALLESLAACPPARPLAPALGRELRECEAQLQQQLAAALQELHAQLLAVRAQRQAHAGYRPPRPSAPAYVSRQA